MRAGLAWRVRAPSFLTLASGLAAWVWVFSAGKRVEEAPASELGLVGWPDGGGAMAGWVKGWVGGRGLAGWEGGGWSDG